MAEGFGQESLARRSAIPIVLRLAKTEMRKFILTDQKFQWGWVAALCLLFVMSGCSAGPNGATKTVEKMYAALSDGDMDAYMDTILPENRRQPNPLGLLNAVSLGFGAGGFSLGFDLSALMNVSVQNLTLTTLQSQNDYALIQAKGSFRYSLLMMELNFCDQHDVRKRAGAWYVDVYAPERQTRLERVLAKRQQQLAAMAAAAPAETGVLETDLMNALGMLGPGMEVALDLCE